MCQEFKQTFERDGLYRLAIARTCCSLLAFCHTYGINKEEAVLAEGIWCYVTQLVIADSADSTTFHLDVKWLRSHVTHEYQHFKRLYVRSCSHKRTSYGNTKLLIIAELAYQLVTVTCGIGYLLYELIVCPSEHLLGDTYDIVGMYLIESKDKCLGQIFHVWLITLRFNSSLV